MKSTPKRLKLTPAFKKKKVYYQEVPVDLKEFLNNKNPYEVRGEYITFLINV